MAGSQAFIRVVPRGGRRTASQIRDQLKYLSREGEVVLQRSERHQSIPLPNDRLDDVAQSWAEETGNYAPNRADAERVQDLTTHIVVSFTPGTDRDRAYAASRAWVERMFGGHQGAMRFDYMTAFHGDRHPHLHIMINRRAYDGDHWLKISKRDPHFNYMNMRLALVDAAAEYGIELEATSRAERGILEPPLTTAEFRRRQRDAIAVWPEDEEEIVVSNEAGPERLNPPTGIVPNEGVTILRGAFGGQASGGNGEPMSLDTRDNVPPVNDASINSIDIPMDDAGQHLIDRLAMEPVPDMLEPEDETNVSSGSSQFEPQRSRKRKRDGAIATSDAAADRLPVPVGQPRPHNNGGTAPLIGPDLGIGGSGQPPSDNSATDRDQAALQDVDRRPTKRPRLEVEERAGQTPRKATRSIQRAGAIGQRSNRRAGSASPEDLDHDAAASGLRPQDGSAEAPKDNALQNRIADPVTHPNLAPLEHRDKSDTIDKSNGLSQSERQRKGKRKRDDAPETEQAVDNMQVVSSARRPGNNGRAAPLQEPDLSAGTSNQSPPGNSAVGRDRKVAEDHDGRPSKRPRLEMEENSSQSRKVATESSRQKNRDAGRTRPNDRDTR